ncbi:MAG: hypothetical protein RSA90_08020 [Lachnospiraceae bacterium]
MKKTIQTATFWEILLLVSILYFFIDVYFLFGVFYITIPLTIIIAIVGSIVSFKEKRYILAVANVLLCIVPVVAFFTMTW